jgi:DNA-binding transcriptional LysR family regulator
MHGFDVKNAPLSLRKLLHAVTVARLGSYMAASRELNISPSALSRSIQSLEDDVGASLFQRRKNGVTATPAGKGVIASAIELLEIEESFRRSISTAQGDVEVVAFGVAPLPASLLLPSLISDFIQEREGAKMRIRTSNSSDLLESLASGEIEFFIAADETVRRMPHLSIEHIGTILTSIRVRKGHPLAALGLVSGEELESYPMMGGNANQGLRFLKISEFGAAYDPVVGCDNYPLLAAALKSCDATAAFARGFRTDDLVDLACAPDAAPKPVGIACVTQRSQRLTARSAKVLKTLTELIGTLG